MRSCKNMRNLISFDIEGFIEASHDIMRIPDRYLSYSEEAREVEANTISIIDFLAENDQKATFFMLGRIARDMPELVRRIADAGHEVGCHSMFHKRLYDLPRTDVIKHIGDAKKMLEDASGKHVAGFRAPDFSITKSNMWVFDVLKEAGFVYDSSVYPTGLHDVYGIRDFPTTPFRFSNGLVEIPMSTINICGMDLPFGGGGYLRLYPLVATKFFFQRANCKGIPVVMYLHPYEMGDTVRMIDEMSAIRKIRTYKGRKGAKTKLASLLREFKFVPISDYLIDVPIEGRTVPLHDED